ncbi:MAG: rhomboid family intramembrane serine protease, partial [Bacteroidetes bacterium]|nr:rhomboid family intramembrane serine protease [Bacteroidota bacterium]
MKLIIINVVVFSVISLINVFYKIGVDLNASTPIDLYVIKYLSLPSSLSSYILQPWSIITYMFWHVNIGHIFWNMLMFYFFGSIFQEYLGSKRLINVYLWGGVVGGLLFITLFNLLPGLSKFSDGASLAGASAAVMAILVASATLLPRYEISIFGIFSVRLPFVAIFMALLSMLGMAGSNAGGEIAHVGGAIFGFIYIKAIYSNFTWFTNLKKKFTAPPKKKEYKPNMKVYEPSKNYYI